MEEENRKTGDDSPLDYEELLNGFAFDGDATDATTTTRGDLDGLALAELLGDEEGEQELLQASGAYDAIAAEDYSSLSLQFEGLNLSEYAGNESGQEPSGPEESTRVEGAPDDAGILVSSGENALESGNEDEDYSSLLSSLELEDESVPDMVSPDEDATLAVHGDGRDEVEARQSGDMETGFMDNPVREDADTIYSSGRGVLDIVNLADDSPVDSGEAEPDFVTAASEAAATENAGDQTEVGAFSLHDLLGEVESPVAPAAPARPSRAEMPTVAAQGGLAEDFLGLSALTPNDGYPRRRDVTAEVMFEGVEMGYDRQVDTVTLAELYLAQGRKKEASDLFSMLAKEKGVTHWVGKRIRLLTGNAEK